MKFSSFLIASACALAANAQRSFLANPPDGATIRVGKKFTVQLIRPNSIQGSQEVGMVIGLVTCQPAIGCPPPGAQIGSVLFNGDFKPVLHEIPAEPYENFTVTVPTGFPTGPAELQTARFHLIGAGPAPILEFNNVTVMVV